MRFGQLVVFVSVALTGLSPLGAQIANHQPRHTNGSPSVDDSRVFQELDELAAKSDLTDAQQLWTLVHAAYNRTLYGSSRRYARMILNIDSDNEKARNYLGYVPRKSGNHRVWANSFEATLLSANHFRHPRFGWMADSERTAAEQDLVRSSDGTRKAIETVDREHRHWKQHRMARGMYFDVHGTVPLEVLWFVADDLDQLVSAYCDLFELPYLPKTRFTAQLYTTESDAEAAGADVALLKTYGAYFYQGKVHAMFRSIGSITAVRHEAAHALNRVYIRRLPQWLDEGIGVYFQFAHAGDHRLLEFGRFPKHAFGTRFIQEVGEGRVEDLPTAAGEGLVTTNSHYYSKYRTMIDFFLRGDEQAHRLRFIRAVFRSQGDVEDLLAAPSISDHWIAYVKSLKPDPNWSPYPDPERAEQIQRLLNQPR